MDYSYVWPAEKERSSRIQTKPETIIRYGYPRLDWSAACLLCKCDQPRWNVFRSKYPGLTADPLFNRSQFQSQLNYLYQCIEPSLIETSRRFSKLWHAFGQEWYDFLNEFFSLNVASLEPIVGTVGIGLIYPRDISNQEFLLPYYSDQQGLLRIAAHETSHFFFYSAERDAGSDLSSSSPSEYELWRLSELLVPLLLRTQEAARMGIELERTSYAGSVEEIMCCESVFHEQYAGKLHWKQARAMMLSALRMSSQSICPKERKSVGK